MAETTGAPKTDQERLIKSLRAHQALLAEILDAMETRDMSPSQIREHLGWVAEGLRDIRKNLAG